jgi:undecaprenyl-diphosphatase
MQSLAGAVVAALTAYASVVFLTRWFHAHDLRPFGWYCLILGALCFVLAVAKVIV